MGLSAGEHKQRKKEKNNMKKQLRSLAMALALCLGLTIPAMAVEAPSMTAEEAVRNNVYVSYDIGSGNINTTLRREPINIRQPDPNNAGKMLDGEFNGYYLVRKDTVFTVEHADVEGDETFVTLAVKFYYKEDGSTVYEADDTYAYYMTKEDGFYREDKDMKEAGGLATLWAGESIQFSLPNLDDGREAVVRLTLEAVDPEVMHGYQLSAMFLPDDDAVDVMLAETAAPEVPAFEDVPEDSFYADSVKWAVSQQITQGDGQGHFFPGKDCTAEQILTFIWRAYGSPASTAVCPFEGVTKESPYYAALCWAGEKGIVDGAGAPSAPCTREMAVTYLWKAAGSPEPTTGNAFSDVPESCAKAVSWAVENEVTQGTGGDRFSPEVVCSRGQIATFLYRNLAD